MAWLQVIFWSLYEFYVYYNQVNKQTNMITYWLLNSGHKFLNLKFITTVYVKTTQSVEFQFLSSNSFLELIDQQNIKALIILMEKNYSHSRSWAHSHHFSSIDEPSSYIISNSSYRMRLSEEADKLVRNIQKINKNEVENKDGIINFKKKKQLRRDSLNKVSALSRIRSISNYNLPTCGGLDFKENSQNKGRNMQIENQNSISKIKCHRLNKKSQIIEHRVLDWSKKQRKKSRKLTGLTDYDKISNLESTVDIPSKQNKGRLFLPGKGIEFRRSLNQLCRKFSKTNIECQQNFLSQEGQIQRQMASSHDLGRLKKSDFQIGKKLGSGNFSTAYLARHIRTNTIYALKVMEKQKIKQENYEQQVTREIKIQFYLSHHNLVQLYAVFSDKNNIYLLMEYCCDGQLYSLIRKSSRIEQENAIPIIKGISKGIQYLHQQMVIHRDLKPENIFLNFGIPKIGDFGWAVYTGADGFMRKTTSGSPLYYSPEIVQKQSYDDKVDIWGLGMITFECLIGMAPFKIYSMMNLDRIIHDDIDFPSYVDVTPQAIQFIECCLKKRPEQRWTISRLLTHAFMNQDME